MIVRNQKITSRYCRHWLSLAYCGLFVELFGSKIGAHMYHILYTDMLCVFVKICVYICINVKMCICPAGQLFGPKIVAWRDIPYTIYQICFVYKCVYMCVYMCICLYVKMYICPAGQRFGRKIVARRAKQSGFALIHKTS